MQKYTKTIKLAYLYNPSCKKKETTLIKQVRLQRRLYGAAEEIEKKRFPSWCNCCKVKNNSHYCYKNLTSILTLSAHVHSCKLHLCQVPNK